MGRHPGFVRAWQVNLQECAHLNIAWNAIEAFRELWPEIEEEPAELEGFDDALRELTMARKVDIGILVELHRSWDSLHRTSAEIVEAVSVDDRAAVVELSDHAEFEYRTVNALSELLLRGQRELHAFQQLGAKIGRAMDWGARSTWMAEEYYLPTQRDLPPALERSPELLDSFAELDKLAIEVGRGNPIFNMGPGKPVGERIAELLVTIDRLIQRLLQGPEASAALIEIDEQRETLVFLGCSLSYSDFRGKELNASGGLAMVVAMARRPREKFTYDELREEAGIVVDDRQIPVYFSRFRKVLTNKLNQNAASSTECTPFRRIGRLIKHHRERKGVKAGYSLDVDPRLVCILS
jgi:hypothetical protein